MHKKSNYKILIFCTIFFFQQSSFDLVFEGIPRVIDGDSLEINGNIIRLFGVDAPEKKQICKKPYFISSFFRLQKNYKCGLLAASQLEKLINNKPVRCISERKDRYCFL